MKDPNKLTNHKLRRRVALGAAVIAAGAGAYETRPSSSDVELGKAKIYRVQPGDSLWGIHQKADLGGDPRGFVYEVDKTFPEDGNHIGTMIQPGDRILLPADAKIGKKVEVDPDIELPTYVAPKDGSGIPLPPAYSPGTNPKPAPALEVPNHPLQNHT